MLLYTAEEGIDDNNYNRGFAVSFGNLLKYKIYLCTTSWQYFTTTPSLTQDDIWSISKTETGLTIELNGDEVLHYIFSSASNSSCVDMYSVEVTRILFGPYDSASVQYREGTATGQSKCKKLEDV